MSRIVVGVDGSEEALHALDWAVDEGRRRGATVEVVHAWTTPHVDPYLPVALDTETFREGAQRALDAAVAGIEDDALGPTIEPKLVYGSPAHVLLEAAQGADLLVVGSHGMGGFVGMLLGSVSHHVLHHATCPVVVVRGAPVAVPG